MPKQRTLLIFMIIGFSALWAWGDECPPKSLKLLTGPTTGHYYQLGKAIEKVAKTKNLHVCAQWVKKTLDNVSDLNAGNAAFAIVQSDVAHDGWHGHGDQFPKKLDKVRLVTPLYLEAVHILLRPHLNIAGLAGLRGKKVWMGPVESATKYTAARVLTAAGVDVKDVDIAETNGPKDFCAAVRQLRTMKLDAVFRVTRAPSPDIQDALEREQENDGEYQPEPSRPDNPSDCVGVSEIELLALDYEVVERLVQDGSYTENLIPKSAYGQTSSTLTIGVQALLLTNKAKNDPDVEVLANLLRTERNTIQQLMADSVKLEHPHQHENFEPQLSLMDVETGGPIRRFIHPLAERYLYHWWRDSWRPLLPFMTCFAIIFFFLVWHRASIRGTLRRQPRIAFAAAGMLLIWCIGSGVLFHLESNVNEYFNSFPRSLESTIFYSISLPGYELVTQHGKSAGQITKWLSLVLLGGLVTPLAKDKLERIIEYVSRWLEKETSTLSQLKAEKINSEKRAAAAGAD